MPDFLKPIGAGSDSPRTRQGARSEMDWESVSDAELSRQCRQGRSEAWRQLVRRCTPVAYRVAIQILRDHAEVEDACQEILLRMYRAFDRYDPTRPLSPWVAKITYNVCLRRSEGVIRKATDLVTPDKLKHSGWLAGQVDRVPGSGWVPVTASG